MREVPVYNLNGKAVDKIILPEQFNVDVRQDLISRAFLALMSHRRQPYGADPLAGKKTSANYRGRRRAYGSWINRGLARLPRIRVGSGHMVGVVRFVPHAVKGRKAHPPKAEKIWYQKINKKERRKAILSAISATAIKDLVLRRGHRVGALEHVPIVVTDDIEKIRKTKELQNFLEKIGLGEELKRAREKKYRAGKGKMRGRRYKKKRGPLIIVEKDEGITKAASNLPGVDVVLVRNLNVAALAPGAHAGRLTIWSMSSIKSLKEKNMFVV